MANMQIGFPNLVSTATISGGTWNSSYPQSNLANRFLSKKARTTAITSSAGTILIDLGSAQAINMIGLISGNFESGSTYTIGGFTASDYATGQLVNLTGTINNTGKQQRDFILGFVNASSARYWKITVTNVAPATYTEIGRLFIGTQLSAANNFSFGEEFGAESNTQLQVSLGGVRHYDPRPNARSFRCVFNWASDVEARSIWMPFLRAADISQEVLIVPFPDDVGSAAYFQLSMLANLRQLNAISAPYTNANSIPLEFVEVI